MSEIDAGAAIAEGEAAIEQNEILSDIGVDRESTEAPLEAENERWMRLNPTGPFRAFREFFIHAIRRYIRQLIGYLPWVQRVYFCQVIAVDDVSKTCTVVYPERTEGTLDDVEYGLNISKVFGEYALRWPVKLPNDLTVDAEPLPYGRPWIKVPQPSTVRWIYYHRADGHIWRIQWPITEDSPHEDLGEILPQPVGAQPF